MKQNSINIMKKKSAKNKNFVSPYQQAGSILNQVWNNSNSTSNISRNSSSSSAAGRLKSVVYDASSGKLKCSASTYAICAKVLANQAMLQLVLECAAASANDEEGNASILGNNSDIQNEGLFYVLLYELLLGPNKAIRGGGSLKRQILQHETVLRSALADIQKEQTATEAKHESSKNKNEQPLPPPFPRYVRINTLRTTTSRALATWKQEQQQNQADEKKTNQKKSGNSFSSTTTLIFYQDAHVPNLLVFPHSATKDILSSSLARNHEVVLQDKSSCFPALCLVHGLDEYIFSTDRRVYLDACAAPGNKTSHLAALALAAATAASRTIKQQPHTEDNGNDDNDDNADDTFPIQVYALDRSKDRCEALKRRMKQLLPDSLDKVQIHTQCRDFLSLGRPAQDDDDDDNKKKTKTNNSKDDKNQKHHKNDENSVNDDHAMVQQVTDILLDPSCSGSGIFHRSNDHEYYDIHEHAKDDSHRLQSLSNFQTTALRHALTNFENAQRVVYSTCSMHEQENEGVVADVLSDPDIAAKWQLVSPTCLREWKRRGRQTQPEQKGDNDDKKSSCAGNSCSLTREQLAALIRVDRDDETNGFFVACFARKQGEQATSSTSHAKETKKNKAKSALTSASVVVEPIHNVPFYNGQFKTTATTSATIESQKSKDKTTESSRKMKDQAPLKNKASAKTSPSNGSSSVLGKKRRSESSTTEESKSTGNQDQEVHKRKQRDDDDPEEPEMPLPKKVAKKLEWKRMQRQSKVQRLHSKHKPKKS
jgi:25S rRNA (cytosine2278-C5)-methyltransferase